MNIQFLSIDERKLIMIRLSLECVTYTSWGHTTNIQKHTLYYDRSQPTVTFIPELFIFSKQQFTHIGKKYIDVLNMMCPYIYQCNSIMSQSSISYCRGAEMALLYVGYAVTGRTQERLSLIHGENMTASDLEEHYNMYSDNDLPVNDQAEYLQSDGYCKKKVNRGHGVNIM